ncbi:uncharacterized protein BDZ83DRAFT_370961 [Colletotrichum acutatum]|uniref:Secreted protein n=1 Tax=Glomerella acutata TaxID=27357 RepID=A0AAD8XDL7_GLOAC|nr:uncharacterized protein BDZ83DRAFT_370961 [Colletotrichum acutatum]KAK1723854.1 hypothetical protein BDZ83DRAFT_370961 [Colletotrichum acutatum]
MMRFGPIVACRCAGCAARCADAMLLLCVSLLLIFATGCCNSMSVVICGSSVPADGMDDHLQYEEGLYLEAQEL